MKLVRALDVHDTMARRKTRTHKWGWSFSLGTNQGHRIWVSFHRFSIHSFHGDSINNHLHGLPGPLYTLWTLVNYMHCLVFWFPFCQQNPWLGPKTNNFALHILGSSTTFMSWTVVWRPGMTRQKVVRKSSKECSPGTTEPWQRRCGILMPTLVPGDGQWGVILSPLKTSRSGEIIWFIWCISSIFKDHLGIRYSLIVSRSADILMSSFSMIHPWWEDPT